jgi:hypothetical protein
MVKLKGILMASGFDFRQRRINIHDPQHSWGLCEQLRTNPLGLNVNQILIEPFSGSEKRNTVFPPIVLGVISIKHLQYKKLIV